MANLLPDLFNGPKQFCPMAERYGWYWEATQTQELCAGLPLE